MRAIRIVLGPHAFIQYAIPDDADFKHIVGEIKAFGHYFNGVDTFIPYERIEAILLIPDAQAGETKSYTGVTH